MRTAIVLAGGAGTRMEPVTRTLNKSLVPIEGVPILMKILLQLEQFGMEKVVVMLGHLSWQVEGVIKNMFLSAGMEIEITNTPADFSTAERLLAGHQSWINSAEIVLIYCDNYIYSEDLGQHLVGTFESRVLVQHRTPGNINLEVKGNISYVRDRSESLNFVELGYWRLNPQVFLRLLTKYVDLQEALQEYTTVERVQALEVSDYLSVSSLSRYVLQRRQERKTIFLDRDGVLVASVGKGKYLKSISQVSFIESNTELFRELSQKYHADYIVVTNQAGIERNIITSDEVNLINQHVALHMLKNNVPILAFYVCPHHWDTGCTCRKPRAGLINEALSQFYLEPAKCILIGDRESDIEAGDAAGIQSFLLTENMSHIRRQRTVGEITQFLERLSSDM